MKGENLQNLVLQKAAMNQIATIALPSTMEAELAETLARLFNADRASTEVSEYLCLVLLHTSWSRDTPLSVDDLLGELDRIAMSDDKRLLDSLAEPSVYLEKARNSRPQMEAVLAHQTAYQCAHRLRSSSRSLNTVHAVARQCVASLTKTEGQLAEVVYRRFEQALTSRGYDTSGERAGSASDQGSEALPAGVRVLSLLDLLQGMGLTGPRSGQSERTEKLPTAAVQERTGPGIELYKREDAINAVQKLPRGGMPGEGNAKQRVLLEQMANEDGWKPLTEVPEGDVLAELYERFPHFKEPLDFIARSLSLASCGEEGRPIAIPPILLRGEPGTGKTYFAQELARVLGAHFVERDLSVTTEAFVLAGMDSGWKNSKPGIVFDALVSGKSANPVICLNEVDKASVTGNHNSPIAPMYALLEPTSAERFVDEFIPVSVDTSRVVWVLTANDGPIPEPILSRLEVFQIQPPNKEECRAIAKSVWTSICERTLPKGHGFATELGESLLDFMSNVSPRVMRKALTHAASNAAFNGRKFLTMEDLEQSQKRYGPAPKRQPIGFAAN